MSILSKGPKLSTVFTPKIIIIFCQSGHEIYESQARQQVEEGNQGKIVEIDIETGAFEISEDSLTAAKKLLNRCPEVQIFGIRIGHRAIHRLGFRLY